MSGRGFRRHGEVTAIALALAVTSWLLFGFAADARTSDASALTVSRLGAVVGSLHATETDASAGLSPATAANRMQRDRAVAHALIARLSTDRGLRRGLIPMFQRFDDALDKEFAQLLRGRVTEAEQLGSRLVDPSYARLERELSDTTEREVAQAASATDRLYAGSLFVLVGASVLIGVIMWRNRRRAVHDATRAERTRTIEASERRFRALVNNGDDVIIVTDAQAVIQSMSDSVRHVLGVEPEPRIGRRVTDLVHPDEVIAAEAEFAKAISSGSAGPSPWRCRDGNGEWHNIEVTWTNMLGLPEVTGVVVNMRDVTDRHRLEEELRHRAFHDSLTGLANRALLRDRIAHAMASREPRDAALLVIDLDGFKHVNDSLGHPAGDYALAVVADRLLRLSRPSDTVARLGGDEFAIFVEDPVSEDGIDVLGNRIVEAIAQPFDWEQHSVVVRASVGVAFVRPGLHTADDLVRDADVGLYAAKQAGRGQVRTFDRNLFDAARTRYELEQDLCSAVNAAELVLHYQPIVTLDTGRPVGVEALVRWQHPTRGLVRPDEFIPIAEETGLIIPIGRWILNQACEDLARWTRAHPNIGAFYVSVNLSARQLEDPQLVSDVHQALADTGLAPSQVVLEITETALMHDRQAALDCFDALKALGVRLSVDDFGTGYSSLSYLRQFPIDTVKIDKSFVDNVAAGRDDAAFVSAILRLSESLHLDTLAEGIETADQAEALQRLGCHLGQGFHYAKPLDTDDIDTLLDQTFTEPLAETIALHPSR